jgi:putative ABC transport system permease protein
MTPLPDGVRRAFRLALRRPRIEQDVDEEVAFHLDMRINELIARGLAPEAARHEALRRFGDTRHWSSAMKETDQRRLASERRSEWFADLRQDVQYALRSFGRAPLFTVLAVVTLALGIGANAAVFGVVKSVLLNALPYAEADRVVRIYGRMRDGSNDRVPVSAGTVTDIRDRARSFRSVTAMLGHPQDGVVSLGDQPVLVKIARTEPDLFRTLGVSAALGRTLIDTDAESDTAFNVVVTHAAWQRLLGADLNAVGRTVQVNGIARVVAGVLPRDFVGPLGDVDFYMPMNIRPMLATVVNARMRQSLFVVARLEPGITVEAAGRELGGIADEISRAFPRETGNVSLMAVPIRDAMVGETRAPLLVLMASAALVLLITCANLAGALLSRTLTRRKEFAIRVALGAGRGRLVRQLLTESTLLAVAGGALGIGLAWAGLSLARGLASHALPEYAAPGLDTGALVVTAVVTLLTGLVFGVAPAISAGRSDPQAGLREESRSAGEGRRSRQLRGVLVAGQIALCVSLLAGAGLLARSLWVMTATPLGFDADRLLSVQVFLPAQRYATGEARTRFLTEFEERLRALPGVTDVASLSQLPTRITARNGFSIIDAPPFPSDARPIALYMDVSDDFFSTLRIPIRAGRAFNAEERAGGPLALIINESMARQYWPNGDAVGARVHLGPTEPNAPVFTVVGVAGDFRNDPARAEPDNVLYLSNRQFPWNGPTLLIRTTADPSLFVAPVRRALTELDPALPLHGVTTMRDVVSEGFAKQRLPVVLMGAFGALALLLASVGVYAMFSAMATAREREFAVRMALGSSPRAIARLVIGQGAVWMGLGLALGMAGIAVASRAVRSLLVGVEPLDPFTFALSALLLVACGTLALLVPVRRATRADPNSVLR